MNTMLNTLMMTNAFDSISNFLIHNHFTQGVVGAVLLFGIAYVLLEGE